MNSNSFKKRFGRSIGRQRTISIGDIDDGVLYPLTDAQSALDDEEADEDDSDSGNEDKLDEEFPVDFKPLMTRKQRRHSMLLNIPLPQFIQQIPASLSPGRESALPGADRAKANWKKAFQKLKTLKDPWASFCIEKLPMETCVRHRYSALKKEWVKDEVLVKMQPKPFNHGAMRACFRLKKNRNGLPWRKAQNYVAKRYMEQVEKDVYFQDVKLQMDAKLWGEEFNRHNPSKKVDIFQMTILEFINRPNKPLYHLEHFIEGHYIKYNSNSGFVDEKLRYTPHAFSHFTFERSGHSLIVVDIQGVGDLWTDPQMHTVDGTEYGDGNLGIRGMALFFHSHICNSICKSMALSKFDLSDSEIEKMDEFIKHSQSPASQMTQVRSPCEHVISASPMDRMDITAFLARSRRRSMSTCSSGGSIQDDDVLGGSHFGSELYRAMSLDEEKENDGDAFDIDMPMPRRSSSHRTLQFSESSDSSLGNLSMEEEKMHEFQKKLSNRPSCRTNELGVVKSFTCQFQDIDESSTLGFIHHHLAKYHESGRFCKADEPIDWEAAVFHEVIAADLGIIEAIITLAKLYLGLPRDILSDYSVHADESSVDIGIDYMMKAAYAGDKYAMIFIGTAFETGHQLGSRRTRSHLKAIEFYNEAVRVSHDEGIGGDIDVAEDMPIYLLKAKIAELYLQGGPDLEKDLSSAGDYFTEAADGAMAAMKGRLANKYYILAEEAYGTGEE